MNNLTINRTNEGLYPIVEVLANKKYKIGFEADGFIHFQFMVATPSGIKKPVNKNVYITGGKYTTTITPKVSGMLYINTGLEKLISFGEEWEQITNLVVEEA
jgi:hypothetical protein